jgi:hypothetical protein
MTEGQAVIIAVGLAIDIFLNLWIISRDFVIKRRSRNERL